MVDQRASSTTAVGYAGAGNLEIQLDGGLDLKTNPHVLQSPKTTRADNALLCDPGQVRQLASVAAVSEITKLYTGGAVPNIEPYAQGSYFQIYEGSSAFDGNPFDAIPTTPIMALNTTDGAYKKSTIAPLYPLTLSTRSFVGDAGLKYNIADEAQQPQPVSVQGFAIGTTDNSKTLVTVQPVISQPGGAVIYVSDLSGNTTSQWRNVADNTGGYFNFAQHALIADPNDANIFYLVASNASVGLCLYTIYLNTANTGQNPIQSVTRSVIDAAGSGYTRFMCCYFQGYPILVFANGTNVRAATLTAGSWSFATTVTADFNTTAQHLAAFSSSNRLFIAIGNVIRAFSATGTGGNFTYAQVSVQQSLDSALPNFEAITGIHNPTTKAITVFGRIFENYTGAAMAAVGYTSTATRIAQVGVAKTGWSTANDQFTTVNNMTLRSDVGFTIRSKAFLLFNNDKGMTGSGSALCAVNLGARWLQGGTFQSGSFIIDHNCQVVGRYNDGNGDLQNVANNASSVTGQLSRGVTEVYWLTEPNNATLFETGFPFLSSTITGGNTAYTAPTSGSKVYALPPSVLGYTINLCNIVYQGQGVVVTPSRIGKALCLNGLLTCEYDGRTLHESGFHFQASPPGPAYDIQPGSNPSGVYFFYQVYRWTDAQGQLHQSAPSPARAVFFSSNWGSCRFVAQPPIHTYKGLDRTTQAVISASAVYVDLYRTSTASADPTGAVAYLVASTPLNNCQHASAAGGFTLTSGLLFDNGNSTTIKTSAPPLYTQSQIAANAPPSFIYSVNSKGRCFGLAQVGSTYRVYFCSPYTDIPFSFASRWNITGFVTVPPELGDCRSLAVLDDKIMVFGTQGVAAFNGDGPSIFDATAEFNYTSNPAQLNYSAVTPLPMPLGTVGCGAPVTIPQGVLYQDRQGIMLIDRGLGATFVGGAVDTLTNTNRYGRPFLYPALNSVLYPNARGAALLYSFDLQRFSQWPALQNSVGAFQGANGTTFSLGVALSNGIVAPASRMYQVRDASISTSTAVSPSVLVLETPWEHIGQGFGGEGSIWEALVTGLYYAPHTLTLEMAYDYGAYEAPQSVSYLTGSTTPQVPYQSKFRPPRRARADVVRFRVTVTPESGSLALECARLTGITLYAAAFRGAQRVGSGVQR